MSNEFFIDLIVTFACDCSEKKVDIITFINAFVPGHNYLHNIFSFQTVQRPLLPCLLQASCWCQLITRSRANRCYNREINNSDSGNLGLTQTPIYWCGPLLFRSPRKLQLKKSPVIFLADFCCSFMKSFVLRYPL